MKGVITHVSNPKISTEYTIALKNIHKTCRLSLSCPSILYNPTQLFIAFLRFPTTAGQSSSESVKI